VPSNSGSPEKSPSVKIVFPVACEYHGGNKELGSHGRHFWIENGLVGHGELRLTHGVPLGDVTSVEVTEREEGGEQVGTLLAVGAAGGGYFSHEPKQVTDIVVRTKDGQAAAWVVEQRGADWVREKLTPVLRQLGIPYDEDLPPADRAR
jgi:hypothetical protein